MVEIMRLRVSFRQEKLKIFVIIYVPADSLVRRDERRCHPATDAVNQEVSEQGCSLVLVNNYKNSNY